MNQFTIPILCLALVFAVGGDARHLPRKQFENNGSLSARRKLQTSGNMTSVVPTDEELMEITKVCNSTFPTPPGDLTVLNETGRYPNDASQNSKCYLFCLLSSLKIIDDKGNPKTSDVEGLFTPGEEDLKQSYNVNKCFTEEKQNKDACEKAYEIISCLIREKMGHNSDKKDGI